MLHYTNDIFWSCLTDISDYRQAEQRNSLAEHFLLPMLELPAQVYFKDKLDHTLNELAKMEQ
jgi:hypothetical protein